MKGKPDTFLIDLDYHKLIYGRALRKEDFPSMYLKEIFFDKVRFVKNKLIPLYKKGKFGFQQLIRQAFWICYQEQQIIGKTPLRIWAGLDKFVKDKKRIIHSACYFRMHPTKDKRKRETFVKAFEKYLSGLEKRPRQGSNLRLHG